MQVVVNGKCGSRHGREKPLRERGRERLGSAAGKRRTISGGASLLARGIDRRMSLPEVTWMSDVEHLMRVLSERILRANTATEELERWCREHAIGDGRVVALRAQDAASEPLDAASLEALGRHAAPGKTQFRRVQLATAAIVLGEALNWYFPDHLTAEMRATLEATRIPFGRVVMALQPKRHTFLVRRSTPDPFTRTRGASLPDVAFEHRAVVFSADDAPLAVVHERFCVTLAGVARSPDAPAKAAPLRDRGVA